MCRLFSCNTTKRADKRRQKDDRFRNASYTWSRISMRMQSESCKNAESSEACFSPRTISTKEKKKKISVIFSKSLKKRKKEREEHSKFYPATKTIA